MVPAESQADALRRLRTAAGHLNAVIEMAEAGRPCEQVLHQLNAVEAALRAASRRLVACKLHESEPVIMFSPSPAARAAELKKLRSLYAILMQSSRQYHEVIK